MSMQKKIEEAQQKMTLLEKIFEVSQKSSIDLVRIIGAFESQVFRCKKNANNEYVITFCAGKLIEDCEFNNDISAGLKVSDIIGNERFAEIKQFYDRAFNGDIVKYEGLLSEGCYFSTILTPICKSEEGIITEIFGVTQEITSARIAEEENKMKIDLLNSIIEHNPYSIQILNAQGYHIRENKAYMELFKCVPEKNWSILKDPIIKENGFYDLLVRVINGEVVATPPIWYNAHAVDSIYPDNPIFIGSVIFPVFLSDGKLEYIVLMHEDITIRVKAEEDLKNRISELEDFHDLTVGRELKMKKMEEEMDELLKRLKENNN